MPYSNHSGSSFFSLSDRGVALVMVLWILTLLMSIVLSFTFLARTESHATLSFRQKMEKRFLAEAGVQRAIMELVYRGPAPAGEIRSAETEPVRVDGTSYSGRISEGSYVYRIVDESGKINLNLLDDKSGLILINLLLNLGVAREQADTIVDSVLDWKDADELHRLHGAESDYYQSLPLPYNSKNVKFDTVDELAMVRGMVPEILYGTQGKGGIIDFLTVNPTTKAINLNSAPREVLAALPGVSKETAEQLIEMRRSTPISSPEDVQSVVGEGFRLMRPYVGTSESNAYTIESTGYMKAEPPGVMVKATVMLEGNGKYSYVYYKSPAGVGRASIQGVQ